MLVYFSCFSMLTVGHFLSLCSCKTLFVILLCEITVVSIPGLVQSLESQGI